MRTFAALTVLVLLSLPVGAFAELRAYDVEAKYRQEIFRALRGVLQPGEKGRVERLPTGQLLIDTTPELHEQVEAVLGAATGCNLARFPGRISLPRNGGRVGLRNDLFEACSAFTLVAACTLASSPIRDTLHRRLQPLRYLHSCSGCFRLERSPGGILTRWEAPP